MQATASQTGALAESMENALYFRIAQSVMNYPCAVLSKNTKRCSHESRSQIGDGRFCVCAYSGIERPADAGYY
jgi:hypothetical protein